METIRNESKGVRNLGLFWLHFGMIKRDFWARGREGEDFISLEKLLEAPFENLRDKIAIKAHYKADFDGAWRTLEMHLDLDKPHIREAIKQTPEIRYR